MSRHEFDDLLVLKGDPATDSARRHMERVLRQEEAPRRWPWFLAMLAGGGSFALWRLARKRDPEGGAAGR